MQAIIQNYIVAIHFAIKIYRECLKQNNPMGNSVPPGIPPLLAKNWQPVPDHPYTYRNKLTFEYAHKHIINVEDSLQIQSLKQRMKQTNLFICRVLFYHQYHESIYHVYADEIHLHPVINISRPDIWTFHKIKIVQAFWQLCQIYGFMKVCSPMIGADSNGHPKVWINPDPVCSKPWNNCKSQSMMLSQIISIFQSIQQKQQLKAKKLGSQYTPTSQKLSNASTQYQTFQQYIKNETKYLNSQQANTSKNIQKNANVNAIVKPRTSAFVQNSSNFGSTTHYNFNFSSNNNININMSTNMTGNAYGTHHYQGQHKKRNYNKSYNYQYPDQNASSNSTYYYNQRHSDFLQLHQYKSQEGHFQQYSQEHIPYSKVNRLQKLFNPVVCQTSRDQEFYKVANFRQNTSYSPIKNSHKYSYNQRPISYKNSPALNQMGQKSFQLQSNKQISTSPNPNPNPNPKNASITKRRQTQNLKPLLAQNRQTQFQKEPVSNSKSNLRSKNTLNYEQYRSAHSKQGAKWQLNKLLNPQTSTNSKSNLISLNSPVSREKKSYYNNNMSAIGSQNQSHQLKQNKSYNQTISNKDAVSPSNFNKKPNYIPYIPAHASRKQSKNVSIPYFLMKSNTQLTNNNSNAWRNQPMPKQRQKYPETERFRQLLTQEQKLFLKAERPVTNINIISTRSIEQDSDDQPQPQPQPQPQALPQAQVENKVPNNQNNLYQESPNKVEQSQSDKEEEYITIRPRLNTVAKLKQQLNFILESPVQPQPRPVSKQYENFKSAQNLYKPLQPQLDRRQQSQQSYGYTNGSQLELEQDRDHATDFNRDESDLIKQKVEEKKVRFAQLKLDAKKILGDDF